MSDPNYSSHSNIASSRNAAVNFNYTWDSSNNQWSPMASSRGDSILSQAKSIVQKFGRNISVSNSVSVDNPIIIADAGNTSYSYPWLSNAGENVHVVIANSADVGKKITVIGLDENFLEQTLELTLASTMASSTGVTWSTATWTRIYRAYNSTTTDDNASPDLEGWVAFRNGSNESLVVIRPENNQTMMGLYTIPDNYTGYLLNYTAGVGIGSNSSAVSMEINCKTRLFNQAHRVRESIQLSSDTGTYSRTFSNPIELAPRTDVYFDITDCNHNGARASINFDIALL